MDYLQLRDKLTPAALEALNELVEDYRNQVLLLAAENASRLTGEVREISVSDLLSAMPSSDISPRSRRPQVIDRILNLYQLLGLLVGLGGFGWFVGRDFIIGLEPQRQLPLLLAAAGVGMSVLAFSFQRLRQARNSLQLRPESLSPSDTSVPAQMGWFIAQWQQIELFIRSIAGSQLGESMASAPFSTLITRLRNDKTLSEDDVVALRRLLELRNSVLHGGRNVGDEELHSALRDADRLLMKLRREPTATNYRSLP
jgi:hypothetical protein